MKISIEFDNQDQRAQSDESHHSIAISHPDDNMDATSLARLVFYAMIGLSYHPSSVCRAFQEVAAENGFEENETGDHGNEQN